MHRLLVVIALCFGFAVRVIAVDSHPPFVHGDGVHLADYSVRVARGEQPWYGVRPDNDTNVAYLQFAPYALFGSDLFALRFMSVWWGVASLAGAYYGTRRLAGSRAALIALYLMAGAHVLVHFSRAATIVMPSVLSGFLAAGLLLRAQDEEDRRRRWLVLALAGAVAALNLYEYVAAKAVFFGLAVLWLSAPALRRRQWRRWLADSAALGGAALLVAAPILVWYYQHPAHLSARFSDLSIFSARHAPLLLKSYGTLETSTVLVRQTARSLGGFFILDDTSPLYHIQAPPMDVAAAILAVAGIIVMARRSPRRLLAMLVWMAAGLTAGAVLLIEPPTSHHYIVLIPLALVFAAVALDWMFSRWVGRPWVPIIVVGIIALNLYLYFAVYPQGGAWHSTASSIGLYARRRASCCRFVYVGPSDATPKRIMDWAAKPASMEYVSNVEQLDASPVPSRQRSPTVYFLPPDREDMLSTMERRYPRGRKEWHVERGYLLFWTLTVE